VDTEAEKQRGLVLFAALKKWNRLSHLFCKDAREQTHEVRGKAVVSLSHELDIDLAIYLSICLYIYLSIYLSIYLFVSHCMSL